MERTNMRLDQFVASKFMISRSRAKDLILQGGVKVNGTTISKGGTLVKEDDSVWVDQSFLQFVNRGGLKLKKALDSFRIDVKGKRALDIGASKGGFTDCLIQYGARSVHAIDVGKAQFDDTLKKDSRIFLFEETDIRDFIRHTNDFDLITCDVSFISIVKLQDVFVHLAKSGVELILLIKPQFELTRNDLGKNGVVKDQKLHTKAIENVVESLTSIGYTWKDCIDSPIIGKDGNKEFLCYFVFE